MRQLLLVVRSTTLNRLHKTPAFPRKHQPRTLAELRLGGLGASDRPDDGRLPLPLSVAKQRHARPRTITAADRLSSEPTVTTGAAIRATTLPQAAATGILARGDVMLRRVRRRAIGSERRADASLPMRQLSGTPLSRPSEWACPMHTTAIVGREEELSTIRRFLAELAAGPTALVISGEPGIGKTVLWEIACEDARRHPGWLLSWRGVEAEAMFAFAGLSELLAGVLEGVAPTLAGPRRRALEVALLLAEPDGQAPDAHAIGLALVDVLGGLCQTGPVLLALDDVQWLDASSVAVIQVAMRRLRQQPVGVLMTLREEPHSRMPFELERSFSRQRITRLSLSALGQGALKQLLRERLEAELSSADLALLHEASGGNPFFALELARSGAHRERRSRFRVPDSLSALLGERLGGLPGEIADVVLTVAVAGRPPVELIAAVFGSSGAVHDALDVAVREGVLRARRGACALRPPAAGVHLLSAGSGEETPGGAPTAGRDGG